MYLGGVDADEDGCAVGLLPLDALDVHAELLSVALHHLADLLALVVAAHHLHLVVLADRHRAHAVLLAKVLQDEKFECRPESKHISEVPCKNVRFGIFPQ